MAALVQDGLLPGYVATRLVELTEDLSDARAVKVEKRVSPWAEAATC